MKQPLYSGRQCWQPLLKEKDNNKSFKNYKFPRIHLLGEAQTSALDLLLQLVYFSVLSSSSLPVLCRRHSCQISFESPSSYKKSPAGSKGGGECALAQAGARNLNQNSNQTSPLYYFRSLVEEPSVHCDGSCVCTL